MNIERILNLIKKTGDKVIVSDSDPLSGQDLVIMPLNEYEKIVESRGDYRQMSEKELLESVERDIALWRAEHEDKWDDMEPPMPEPWEMEKDRLPWEDEEIREIEDIKVNKEENVGTGLDLSEDGEIPEFMSEDEEDEGNEPIKYEDIPPPPDLGVSDLMGEDNLPELEEPVIEMDKEDEESNFSDSEGGFEEGDEEEGFVEEPVF